MSLELGPGITFGPGVRIDPVTPEVVTSGLQLYLKANTYSGTGTTWTDSSVNAYATTLVGAPTWNTDYFTFDGSTQYDDVGQSLAFETFSIGAWFRTTSSGYQMLISKETIAGGPWNYRLYLGGGDIISDIAAGGSTAISASGSYNDGGWYYIMATYDATNWYLYANGVEIATASSGISGPITSSQSVWIGRSYYLGGNYQFTGDFGQAFIYDRALTAGEVLQNYNATRGRFGL